MKIKNVEKVENLTEITNNIVNSEDSKSSKIKQLFRIGYNIKDIANILNIRYNFAYNVITNYVITDEIELIEETKYSKKDEIFKLFKEGKSSKEIAITLKTNLNYIYKIINEIKDSEEFEQLKKSK